MTLEEKKIAVDILIEKYIKMETYEKCAKDLIIRPGDHTPIIRILTEQYGIAKEEYVDYKETLTNLLNQPESNLEKN